jgi:hypothetical protein
MSQLRAEFKDTTSGSVSMSELRRGGSFISNDLFVDPNSTIKTTSTAGSNMGISGYYGTTKGRVLLITGRDFTPGTDNETDRRDTSGGGNQNGMIIHTIPANCRRIQFAVQAGGGGAGRWEGTDTNSQAARHAAGGGGGGFVGTFGNTWQNLPESYAGVGKFWTVTGGGGEEAWQGNVGGPGRGYRSEFILAAPGDDGRPASWLTTQSNSAFTSDTNPGNAPTAPYRIWYVAEGGGPASAGQPGGTTQSTWGGNGGRAYSIHNGIPGQTSVAARRPEDVHGTAILTTGYNPFPNNINTPFVDIAMEGAARSSYNTNAGCTSDTSDGSYLCRTAFGAPAGGDSFIMGGQASAAILAAAGNDRGSGGSTSAYARTNIYTNFNTGWRFWHDASAECGRPGWVAVRY